MATTAIVAPESVEPAASALEAPAAAAPEAPAQATPDELALLAGRLYRLSVAQYEAMACAGILTKYDRIELIDGLLVQKMTKYPPHVHSTRMVVKHLRQVLPAGWLVAKEDPITTLESVPEPDVTILRGTEQDYGDRWPAPSDVALVVEVSDSSLRFDQTIKKRAYARAGIPHYWIVNIPDRRLEVHDGPTGPAEAPDYRVRLLLGPDDSAPLIVAGSEVARILVRDLLP